MEIDDGEADRDLKGKSRDAADGLCRPMGLSHLPSLSETGLLEMRPWSMPTLAETLINHNLSKKTYDWRELEDGGAWRHPYRAHQTISKTSVRHGAWHPHDGYAIRSPLAESGIPFVHRITYESESEYIGAAYQSPSMRHPSLLPWQLAGNHAVTQSDPESHSVSHETDCMLPGRDESMASSLLNGSRNDEPLAMEALMAAANRYPANAGGRNRAPAFYNDHGLASLSFNFYPSNSPYRTSPESLPPSQHYCDFSGCGKGFPSKSRLQRHIFVHTGERPFACLHPQCDRRFSRKDNMLQHYRTHLVKGSGLDHGFAENK